MRILSDILYKVKIKAVHGSTQVEVANLCQDSRLVAENSLFVAVKGFNVDGHAYIEKAIDLGAVAIVCQELPKEINDDVVYVQVADSAEALALIACNFYDNPSEKVKLVAITGTNGKTSVATLLWQLYKSLGYQVGLLSTVENKIGDKVIKATHTTPNAIALNELLAKMVDAGCEFVFIEASSHAIDQNRTYGLSFDGAVFTNLTHDHLDYHDTFLEYRNAKKRLFDLLPKTAFALTNADDKNGMVMLQNTKATQKSYALRTMSDFNAKVLENDFAGMIMNLDGAEFCSKLIGHFNAYNMLAVYATAILLGNEKMEVLTAMSALQGAEGRFDIVISPREKIVSIVDYAHTPDALKNVLQTINAVKHGDKKTITVVGCGGDRDATKRPLMAAIACKLSQKVILTSDNPRTEVPSEILEDMRKGVEVIDRKKVLVIENREEAIRTACTLAESNDVVLVAGKGHEKYQEVNGVRHGFDDKEKLRTAFKEFEL